MERIAETDLNGFTVTLFRGIGPDAGTFWVLLQADNSPDEWSTFHAASAAWSEYVKWARMVTDMPGDV